MEKYVLDGQTVIDGWEKELSRCKEEDEEKHEE